MKGLWSFFGKNPKDIFLEFNPMMSHWRILTWNFDLDSTRKRSWTIEVHGLKKQVFHWINDNKTNLYFFENDKLIQKKRISEKEKSLKDLMNLSIHSTLKYSIEKNHEFMLTPVTGVTAMDMQNELRYLQWIQASFGTLKKALESLKTNKDQILTAGFFSGKVPESGENLLRLIVFNLDIFYYLKEDGLLHILIFDDKNYGQGSAKTPTFQQIIKVTKPQFYDEIIKVLNLMAQLGEIG